MDGEFWFKVVFVIGVIIAQGVLWSWVFLQKRKYLRGVPIVNWAELSDSVKRFANRRQPDG